jgi:hypothetical protein
MASISGAAPAGGLETAAAGRGVSCLGWVNEIPAPEPTIPVAINRLHDNFDSMWPTPTDLHCSLSEHRIGGA